MSSLSAKERVIKTLSVYGYSLSPHVRQAFLELDRALFLPKELRHLADKDTPLPLPKNQTISAIHMVLIMVSREISNPQPGQNVLEIGTGSGYNAALLAKIVQSPDNGYVTSIETIPELYFFARENLERAGLGKSVDVILGDGTKGFEENAPYDLIYVTAAAPKIPQPLIEQLKINGKLVIPVGNRASQTLQVVSKITETEYNISDHGQVMFVPLKGEYGWPND